MSNLFVESQVRFKDFVKDDQEGDLINLQRLLIEGLNYTFADIKTAYVLDCKEWVEDEMVKKVSEKVEYWFIQDGLNRKIAEIRVDLSECFTVLRKMGGVSPADLDQDLAVSGMRTWLDLTKAGRDKDYDCLVEFVNRVDIWLHTWGSKVEYIGVSDNGSIELMVWIPMCNQCRISFEIFNAPWLH